MEKQPGLSGTEAGNVKDPGSAHDFQYTSGPLSKDTKTAIIPDLFVSFLSQKPRINPHSQSMRHESADWIKGILSLTEKQYEKVVGTETPLLASLFYPDASREDLRIMCDWLSWDLFFDDSDVQILFNPAIDDGKLRNDSEGAREEMKALIELMTSSDPVRYSAAYHPLRYAYQDMWDRYSKIRLLALLCWIIHGLDIPDAIFEHPSIRKNQDIVANLVVLSNDLLSIHKERSMGVGHNLVHLFRQDGLSEQQAYDQIDVMMRGLYKDWYLARAEIPVCNETVDSQVLLYVKACELIALGNLYWSFECQRYFGKEGPTVKKTRIVTLAD
ncbi:MAG: hypothetical protein Q9169_002804 [Polycauliona sp. 2 TL-2023]